MTMLARLGLGTVQFGEAYGVSNRAGCPTEREVAAIVAHAVAAGVGYIDTAPAYGDAEILIGRHLERVNTVRIVTKIPALKDETIEARHRKYILETLATSLEHLKAGAVHGLLVHQPHDLAKPGWQHLVEAMAEAKALGWTSRIGASVYNAEQLALVESRFRPELVQLPLNVLDRRPIVLGTLARLNASGVEIHARSVFLQGLLLMEAAELPEFFAPVRHSIADVREKWSQRGLSALTGCLTFASRQPEVDAVIVGVNRLKEFEQIEAAVTSSIAEDVDIDIGQEIDPEYLDPSRWPGFVH
jgi:aryl-alcohol dehydrogenase-like predicted oxidoreductase